MRLKQINNELLFNELEVNKVYKVIAINSESPKSTQDYIDHIIFMSNGKHVVDLTTGEFWVTAPENFIYTEIVKGTELVV